MQKYFREEYGQLEKIYNSKTAKINSLKGQCELLYKQIQKSSSNIEELKTKDELCHKVVELLTFVQKTTEEKIKNGFESIVTYALRYIYGEDYKFILEFGRRGNLQEINFNIQKPGFEQPYDPLLSSAGGVLDIISLALRIALLELSVPKIKGFLVLDESFKHLHPIPTHYLERACEFLKAINQKIGRQIILITGRHQLIENADNIIKIEK